MSESSSFAIKSVCHVLGDLKGFGSLFSVKCLLKHRLQDAVINANNLSDSKNCSSTKRSSDSFSFGPIYEIGPKERLLSKQLTRRNRISHPFPQPQLNPERSAKSFL